MQVTRVKVICPICDEVMKNMKAGDKDQGGEVKCKDCGELSFCPKILVLEPVKVVPPAPEE
jgi:translation initiation factor 2 beta subunit (eIF-2beta)/eIF-5